MEPRRWTVGNLAACCCLLLLAVPRARAQGEPPADRVEVPRTADAAALARQVVERLHAFHYALRRTDAPGALASFKVEKDGQRAGVLRVSWTRANDEIRAIYEGGLGQDAAKALESLAWRGFSLALAARWEIEGVYGVEQAERFVLDPIELESSRSAGETLHVDSVAKDLLSWRHEIVHRDGSEFREESRYEAAEGAAHIVSTTNVRREAGQPEHRLDFTYRYARRDGRVFVKRIDVREVSGQATTAWRFELDRVDFRAPEAPAAAPAEEALAKEVIEKIERDHYALHHKVEAFDALYAVEFEGRPLGRIRLTWDSASWDLVARFDGTVPRDIVASFRERSTQTFEEWAEGEFSLWLWDAVLLGFGRFGSDYIDRAKRTADGVIVLQTDRTGIRHLQTAITLVAPDGCVRSVERRYRSGMAELRAFDHRAVDGAFVKKSASHTVRTADGGQWNRSISYVYKRQDGLLFPKRILSSIKGDTAEPGASGDTTLELVELTFRGVKGPEEGKGGQ